MNPKREFSISKHADIVASAALDPRGPASIKREFNALLKNGAKLRPAGLGKNDPTRLVANYAPRHRIDLFDTRYYLSGPLQNPAIRFLVAYVVQPRGESFDIYPRIFYKDISLVWRTASHMIATDEEFWIGKGDVVEGTEDGHTILYSKESTTDLPLEIQSALEVINRSTKNVPDDEKALFQVLRNAPNGRVMPYDDFTKLRRRATSFPWGRINGGRPVAKFGKKTDPSSLRVTKGFDPDYRDGVLEVTHSLSRLYGGALTRYRIASQNRKIQYLFFRGTSHVWIIPPQAFTTELSSFGVRTVDVEAPEDMFVPGFEYHYRDPDVNESEHFSQIPEGFAGALCEADPDRADASAWIDKLPIVKEFRRKVRRGKKPNKALVQRAD